MSALGHHLTRRDLSGPGLRILNRGGFANPDVLAVARAGGGLWVVKDYAQRSALVRRLLAPLLVRHELGLLRRAVGLPGLPRRCFRVDRLALAMSHIDGIALQSRAHVRSLSPAFFDALEGILAGLAARRVTHLDLSSPSNVLVTASGGPALIDLGGATGLPVPAFVRRRLERRALAKLRRRFVGDGPGFELLPPPYGQIDLGGVRLRFFDEGVLGDPIPALLVHDVPGVSAQLLPWLQAAGKSGRRALAADVPGFGGSRRPRGAVSPASTAGWLLDFLDATRVWRVDLVGVGWGALVARALAARAPERVRAVRTAGATPAALLERAERADSAPEMLRAQAVAELSWLPAGLAYVAAELGATSPGEIRAAWEEPLRPGDAPRERPIELDAKCPERLWQELSAAGG